jgi:general stress protein YciG
METPKEYYYTYYSYEEWGKGYFGSRGCKCLPEEDVKYFGSFKDKTFKPTQKIILKSDYATREEAYDDEIILQQYYKVVENPHFANRAYQTSKKFYVSIEEAIENGRKAGNKTYKLGLGVHSLTKEKKIQAGKKGGAKGGNKTYELGLGIHGRNKEQMIEDAKKGGTRVKQLGIGIHGRSKEQMREDNKKSGQKSYELGVGVHSLTKDELSKAGKRGGKIVSSQRWECTETGFVANAGNLAKYQRARGIDTSKRVRIA